MASLWRSLLTTFRDLITSIFGKKTELGASNIPRMCGGTPKAQNLVSQTDLFGPVKSNKQETHKLLFRWSVPASSRDDHGTVHWNFTYAFPFSKKYPMARPQYIYNSPEVSNCVCASTNTFPACIRAITNSPKSCFLHVLVLRRGAFSPPSQVLAIPSPFLDAPSPAPFLDTEPCN